VGLTAWLLFFGKDGKDGLGVVTLDFTPDDCSSLKTIFVEKCGEPRKRETSTVQNKMGTQFQERHAPPLPRCAEDSLSALTIGRSRRVR
jgi:hypothetical protein